MFELKKVSMLTCNINTMCLPISESEYKEQLKKWENGMYIQDAFPMLTPEQREFIMTGVIPEEWDAAFDLEDY